MNLDAYSIRDVQIFLQLCQMAEGEGVHDLRFVRQRLQDQIGKKERSIDDSQVSRVVKRAILKDAAPCPNCGTRTGMITADGEIIRQCPKCRWSALIDRREK